MCVWGGTVGRLLTICALISLPGASWSGGAYQGPTPVRGLPEPVGEGDSSSPCQGPGGSLTIPASHPLACPRAAFFTTSGYRTLHEFRSQWNDFRILVNRKLGVFHKRSITAVGCTEPGLGEVTDAQAGGQAPSPAHLVGPAPTGAPRSAGDLALGWGI